MLDFGRLYQTNINLFFFFSIDWQENQMEASDIQAVFEGGFSH